MPALTCQAIGCDVSRTRSQFMCTCHWKALPMPLRRQINACWRAWRDAEGDARQETWIDLAEAHDEAQRWTAEGEGLIAYFKPRAPRLRLLRTTQADGTAS